MNAVQVAYTEGLHELGDGLFAYLQPDGGWGWSNAGLDTAAGTSLLIDTLYDLRSTREMLDAELGPAHTGGDTIVHVPDADVVFTGDLLFNQGTPIVWADYDNWIAARDRILELDAAVLVPGHGPVTDASGLRDLRHYVV
jgi:glyoxylase-like metal-dependent hydrolase (beta-lactamase superfamily II)